MRFYVQHNTNITVLKMDFDEVLNLEEQFYKEGFEEGQAESTKKSFLEGKEYGLQAAFQKYVFVGQVQGIVDLLVEGFGGELSGQAKSQLDQIVVLIDSIKTDNDYGNVVESEKIITKIRNKVRILM
ncbi:hypothetical protein WICANDRAFT_44830, partial [Wickerhamomyces anomalus NRRL Y-366-8]